jgi:hypothetical protein
MHDEICNANASVGFVRRPDSEGQMVNFAPTGRTARRKIQDLTS